MCHSLDAQFVFGISTSGGDPTIYFKIPDAKLENSILIDIYQYQYMMSMVDVKAEEL